MQGNIIKANFSGEDTRPYKTSLPVKELMRCEANGLAVRLTEPNDGQYTVSIYQNDPLAATYRSTDNHGKAVVVFNAIAEYIEQGEKSFDELATMLMALNMEGKA